MAQHAAHIRDQGQQIGRGISEGVDKGLRAYGAARADRRAQEAADRQAKMAEVEQQKSELELSRMPEFQEEQLAGLRSGREFQQKQMAGMDTQQRLQQLQLQAAERINEFKMSDAVAAGFGDLGAKPGETVEQFMRRAETSAQHAELGMVKQRLKSLVQDIEFRAQLQPGALAMQEGQIASMAAQMRNNKLAYAMNQIQHNRTLRAYRTEEAASKIRFITNQVGQSINPNMAPTARANLINTTVAGKMKQDGYLPEEIAEAHAYNVASMQDAKMKQMYMAQLDPTTKFDIEKIEKAKQYNQTLNQLRNLAARVDPRDWNNMRNESEKSAMDELAYIFEQMGKTAQAERIRSDTPWGIGTTRDVINQTIKELAQDFQADIGNPNSIGSVWRSPSVVDTFNSFNETLQGLKLVQPSLSPHNFRGLLNKSYIGAPTPPAGAYGQPQAPAMGRNLQLNNLRRQPPRGSTTQRFLGG